MSHTSVFQIPGYQGDVLVIHNGDWSGDAIIRFQEEVFGTWDKQDKPVKEAQIPGKFLIALSLDVAKEAVADEVIRLMEDLPNVMRLRKAAADTVKDSALRRKKASAEASYHGTDDKAYGTKFVYCTQHRRIHETGWCTVAVVDKIPLLSQTIEEAETEWNRKKVWLVKETK